MRTTRGGSHRFARMAAALLAAAAVGGVSPLTALATTHSPPWGDAISSHYPGTNGLDTTGSGAKMKSRLIQMGYSGFNDINISAASALGSGYALDDAVWGVFGHGGPGGISTYYPSVGDWTWIFATSAVGSCSYPNGCLSSPGTALHRIKLALFVGCETAVTSHSVNLLTVGHTTDGIDSTLGFSQLIYWPMADTWTDMFFWNAYSGPYDVTTSAWNAEASVVSRYGSPYGFDSVVIQGGTVRIYPAGYGS